MLARERTEPSRAEARQVTQDRLMLRHRRDFDRHEYKFLVSGFRFRVGILSDLELETQNPELRPGATLRLIPVMLIKD